MLEVLHQGIDLVNLFNHMIVVFMTTGMIINVDAGVFRVTKCSCMTKLTVINIYYFITNLEYYITPH